MKEGYILCLEQEKKTKEDKVKKTALSEENEESCTEEREDALSHIPK